MWNSAGGWKKYQKLIVGRITWKNFNSWGLVGWLLNCFFLSFSNHENYGIKNIFVYSRSKIKTKVTNKQKLEHFKMINRRLFIHKFCNYSKMFLSFSWAIFIRVLVFLSSASVNFSSFEKLCFPFLVIFRFIHI